MSRIVRCAHSHVIAYIRHQLKQAAPLLLQLIHHRVAARSNPFIDVPIAIIGHILSFGGFAAAARVSKLFCEAARVHCSYITSSCNLSAIPKTIARRQYAHILVDKSTHDRTVSSSVKARAVSFLDLPRYPAHLFETVIDASNLDSLDIIGTAARPDTFMRLFPKPVPSVASLIFDHSENRDFIYHLTLTFPELRKLTLQRDDVPVSQFTTILNGMPKLTSLTIGFDIKDMEQYMVRLRIHPRTLRKLTLLCHVMMDLRLYSAFRAPENVTLPRVENLIIKLETQHLDHMYYRTLLDWNRKFDVKNLTVTTITGMRFKEGLGYKHLRAVNVRYHSRLKMPAPRVTSLSASYESTWMPFVSFEKLTSLTLIMPKCASETWKAVEAAVNLVALRILVEDYPPNGCPCDGVARSAPWRRSRPFARGTFRCLSQLALWCSTNFIYIDEVSWSDLLYCKTLTELTVDAELCKWFESRVSEFFTPLISECRDF